MTDDRSSHRLLIEAIDGYVDEEVGDEAVREAYERITDGFFAVDEDWEITYINRKATELLGADRSEVLGDCLWDAFPDTRGSIFHKKSQTAMEEQRPVSYEGYYGFLDKWFQVNAYPSEDGLSVYFREVTEEKEKEKEIELQACAVDRLNDILWIFEPGFTEVLFVNSAYEEILGQSVEALDENPTAFLDATHPDDRDLMREKMDEVSSGESVDFEVRVNPDEEYGRWIWINGEPIYDDGELTAVAGFSRDVTERKERERELERYEAFVEESSDAITLLDEDGTVRYNSRSVERILGHGKGERVGEKAFDYVHPDDRERVAEKFAEFVENDEEKVKETEFRLRKGDGSYAWVEAVATDASGVDGFVVNVRDITERREREQAVREIKERLDLAVEAGNLGVWEWDVENGEFTIDVDRYSMLGDMPELPLDSTITVDDWEENTHPDDLPEVWDSIERHFEGDSERFDAEMRMRGLDGDWKWIRTIGQVVERDGGEPVRAVGVHVDIDERKSNERRLERQNKYLDRIKDASREMIAAESSEGVEEVLVGVGEELFEEADFYRWDDGKLRNEGEEVSNRGDSPAWQAFTGGEVVLSAADNGEFEIYDADDCPCFDEGTEDEAVRLDAPVGEHGVFSVYCSSFCEPIESFVNSVVATAETSLERVEKESRLREVVDELQKKNETLERVTEIDDVVRELIKEVVESDSRESIEETVCEQILEVEDWEHAWIVEADGDGIEPSCCCGENGFSEMLVGSVEGSPLEKSLDDGEVRVVNDVATADLTDWRRTVLNQGYLSVATIPIEYGARSFGVLEVYSSQTGAFDNGYLDALVDAAKVAGYAFTSAEQVSSILSGGFSRLTLRIDQDDVDCFFARLVRRLDHEFRINAVVPGPDGTIVYFKTDAPDEKLHDAAVSMGVELSETINGYGATASEMSVVDSAMELGGRVSRFDSGENAVVVDVDLPQGTDARDLVDVVSERNPSVELVARKSADEPEMRASPLEDLTDRQKTVLRLAYESGFFETPREKTGQDLADSLGITATTFHQHLRSAEKKIVDSILDGPK